jgi:hypothetical protein
MKTDATDQVQPEKGTRRGFLKKAGTIVVAAPIIESLSREGVLVRSARAQTAQFSGLGGPMAGQLVDND